MYIFVLVFLVLFDIYILFLLRVNCIVEYRRNDFDDNIVVSFYTLNGEFKYKFEIPLINFGRTDIKFRIVREQGKKEKIESKQDRMVRLTEIYEKYIDFRDFYNKNRVAVCDIREYIKDKIILSEFRLVIKEGMENASHTGLLCGFLWTAAGLFNSFLSNQFRVHKKHVSITPNYNKKEFTIDFHCIFHLKVVHIIVMMLKIRKSLKRKKLSEKTGGGTNDRASNRGAYDNSNGKYQGNG